MFGTWRLHVSKSPLLHWR